MAESTPGDYYERQRAKAESIHSELMQLRTLLTLCYCDNCNDLREQIRGLERKLEQARYTGD